MVLLRTVTVFIPFICYICDNYNACCIQNAQYPMFGCMHISTGNWRFMQLLKAGDTSTIVSCFLQDHCKHLLYSVNDKLLEELPQLEALFVWPKRDRHHRKLAKHLGKLSHTHTHTHTHLHLTKKKLTKKQFKQQRKSLRTHSVSVRNLIWTASHLLPFKFPFNFSLLFIISNVF